MAKDISIVLAGVGGQGTLIAVFRHCGSVWAMLSSVLSQRGLSSVRDAVS